MVAQCKGRVGTDYVARVLAQPSLKVQLDKEQLNTRHPVRSSFQWRLKTFSRRKGVSGVPQAVLQDCSRLTNKGAAGAISLSREPVCVMLTHCSPTLQARSRCFLMGQLTSSSRPAQTFGMVPISTRSLALTGGQLCHLVRSGAAEQLQRELGHSPLEFPLLVLVKPFNRSFK